ncbi:MAG: PQQ-dependent sugar dehydrogenase [Marmoricola sp.]|nr:PQQ-dependent sugar dehydrogenase [Marmoricola sp.]
MLRTTLVMSPAFALLAACGGEAADPEGAGPPPTVASAQPTQAVSPTPPATTAAPARTNPKVVGTVATGLAVPWGIGFLPDGSALVTERDSGRVLQVRPRAGTAKAKVTEVGTVNASSSLESGLLGLAVSPSYARDKQVFLYASTGTDNRVLRATFDNGRLGTPTPILTGIPRGQIHDGGRLQFGPDGYLYVSTGESGDPELAQQKGSLGGKILRITTTGKPAPGNPDKKSAVWTLGHRNVQGLAFDADGNLWASEFGQDSFDELNLIRKGINYGWPRVEGRGTIKEFRNPQVVWRTDEASPSGLAFLDGRLWLASLKGERLWRIDVKDAKATDPKDYFVGKYGRMRTVAVAPDGRLWVTTSNRDGRGDPQSEDDRILLVDPGTS